MADTDEEREKSYHLNTRFKNHSNGLGAGFGGGGFAFATRSKRFERAAAGFCQERSTIFMASTIGRRTMPFAWSTQPTLLRASASAARSSARARARSAARPAPRGGGSVYLCIAQTRAATIQKEPRIAMA